jgi:hypothetical protein
MILFTVVPQKVTASSSKSSLMLSKSLESHASPSTFLRCLATVSIIRKAKNDFDRTSTCWSAGANRFTARPWSVVGKGLLYNSKGNLYSNSVLSSYLTNTTTTSTIKVCYRPFSTATPPASPLSLEGYYHIEASNAIPTDGSIVYATRLTVTGPDVDGILASMTVALAIKGCSLVSLHAAKSQDMGYRESACSSSDQDRVSYNKEEEEEEEDSSTSTTKYSENAHDSNNTIKDVFYVVDRLTGQPFLDEELYDLAESLLESLKTPMDVVLGSASLGGTTKYYNNKNNPSDNNNYNSIQSVLQQQPTPPYPTRNEQISVINSDGTTTPSL